MNYIRVYWSIIHNRLHNKVEGYTEHHHIIPRSEGGPDNNDNIVALTAREHYICHLLLAKIYNDYKMLSAVVFMQCKSHSNKRDFKFNSRLYACVRKEFAVKMSIVHKGKHHSEATRRKMSEIKRGKHCSDETKKKLSDINSGKYNPFFGKHHTDESRRKMSKKVFQYDLNGNFIAEFKSQGEAAASLGLKSQCNLCSAMKNKLPYRNFIWKYMREELD